jgi:hypothetical protein
MLRRGSRRAFGLLPPLPPEMILQMVQAHRLFAVGQYSQSATLLENLANSARASGLPRAPRLFFQAARANWHANQVPHGMDLMRIALDLLVAAGAVDIAGQIASLAMTELSSMGHKQCGAAVRSDEVDWIDAVTAACAYCGSPVRTEKA